jgi:hypothetical protein
MELWHIDAGLIFVLAEGVPCRYQSAVCDEEPLVLMAIMPCCCSASAKRSTYALHIFT